jgi:hypothetical protein
MTTSSLDTSGEWRHVELPKIDYGHAGTFEARCGFCRDTWPCDAETMRLALDKERRMADTEVAALRDGLDAATQRAEKAEAALDGLREAIAGLQGVPFYANRPNEYMCPKCVTPWKCNGPHTPEERQAAGESVDRAAVLALLPTDNEGAAT